MHKIQETSFTKSYAEQSSLLLSFRLKLKTSLLIFSSLSNEFHIFTVLLIETFLATRRFK